MKKSMKLRCTGARMTGPVAGTRSAPCTRTRQSTRQMVWASSRAARYRTSGTPTWNERPGARRVGHVVCRHRSTSSRMSNASRRVESIRTASSARSSGCGRGDTFRPASSRSRRTRSVATSATLRAVAALPRPPAGPYAGVGGQVHLQVGVGQHDVADARVPPPRPRHARRHPGRRWRATDSFRARGGWPPPPTRWRRLRWCGSPRSRPPRRPAPRAHLQLHALGQPPTAGSSAGSIPYHATAQATARYIAPVSRRSTPRASASSRASVDLPAPARPSMATTGLRRPAPLTRPPRARGEVFHETRIARRHRLPAVDAARRPPPPPTPPPPPPWPCGDRRGCRCARGAGGRTGHHQVVAVALAPGAESARELDHAHNRSDSFTRSSPTPRRRVHPISERGGDGEGGDLVEPCDLGHVDLGRPQRHGAHDEVGHAPGTSMAAGAAVMSAPMRRSTSRWPVRAGPAYTPSTTISLPGTMVAATTQKAACDGSADGNADRLEAAPSGARRGRRGRPSRAQRRRTAPAPPRCAAGPDRLAHHRLALGAQPGQEHARLHLRARHRRRVVDAVQRPTVNGERGLDSLPWPWTRDPYPREARPPGPWAGSRARRRRRR